MTTAVVTGVGVVGSFGCGLSALAEALRASRPVLSEVDRAARDHLPESARTAALIRAADVATGSVERALTGAADESPPLVHALLDRYRALSRPGADGGEAARPFDRRRSGFCLGEGATVLVVEEEAAARTRGARILARVWAWGSAFDPSASRVSWGCGHEPLARAARRMLDRASLAPSDIDLVVSGASGSVAGDRLESATLHALWGAAPLPPVLAPKSVTGEYGGAQLGAAILATAGAEVGPTAGLQTLDPPLRLI